jgi:predicted Zn-dependent peptidase
VASIDLPHLHSSLVSVFVRAGSRHEARPTNGVSHLLEHLLFRGSSNFPDARALAATVERSGGELRGATGRDHTLLQTAVHPSLLEVSFEVLGDLVARPLFAEFALEREIVLEELLSAADEQGRVLDLDDLSMSGLFGDHPLSWPIGGTQASVAGLDEGALRRHHALAYVARNAVLVCGGPASHAQTVELAERYFGTLPSGASLSEGPLPPLPGPMPQVLLVDRPASQVELRLAFRCAPQGSAGFAALRVLRRILGDGLGSRLQERLVEKRALAYAVNASLGGFSDCGVFTITTLCAPQKAVALVSVLLEVLAELCATEVSEDDLASVRQRSRVRSDFLLDSPGEVVDWVGLGDLLHTPPEGVEAWLRGLEQVTAADVRRAAASLFRRGGLAACAVGPMAGVETALRLALSEARGLPR